MKEILKSYPKEIRDIFKSLLRMYDYTYQRLCKMSVAPEQQYETHKFSEWMEQEARAIFQSGVDVLNIKNERIYDGFVNLCEYLLVFSLGDYDKMLDWLITVPTRFEIELVNGDEV